MDSENTQNIDLNQFLTVQEQLELKVFFEESMKLYKIINFK